ncbi:MAG TPA: excinuclease ABC subunit UvrB [Chitinivibrionales bacterium]|jgi:excinuclease ABC subunit B|nr:excinuclease ABC subunit UvrB [Chitinivibrionales bacterium]
MNFRLVSDFKPAGDQPEAIGQLVDGLGRGAKHQTLLGVTGSGKTFTIANVIERVQMPTLIISHNKTLAAQLFQEFKAYFPENAVEYFVSFYDFYQPEAYIPSTDTYIEKTSEINDEIDRLRLKATSSLLSRKDVIIVASVSCIYNIGSPDSYAAASMRICAGTDLGRDAFFRSLDRMQYERNDMVLSRGTFRVRGDIIELQPAYDETGLRIELFGERVEAIRRIHPLTAKVITTLDEITIFPAKHFTTSRVGIESAAQKIHAELQEQLEKFRAAGKLLEAQRLEQRTLYDIEMLREVGFVSGIENYSRILDGRAPGSRPYTLIDFFKPPFLTVIDESHATIPQIQGMFNGDRARKETLVEHGFRIPCALDNRPLRFAEFESMVDNVIYDSATPADYELRRSGGVVVEQVIRPTWLVDPVIEIKPATNQVDDLVGQLRTIVEKGQRSLVTTLTKKTAEDLTEYLTTLNFRVRYLHSEIETLERSDIIRDLRLGEFDILVGINLLREGLDLPEVALVAILDADREGFLRSARSLIQIAGRAARNVEGKIVLYADVMTDSIKKTMEESGRRRTKQLAFNKKHGITPVSITRKIQERLFTPADEEPAREEAARVREKAAAYSPVDFDKEGTGDIEQRIRKLENEMRDAAKKLEFEKAAKIRDRIDELRRSA